MADQYDPMKDPKKHAAPAKKLTDKIIELALGAGGGAVTLLSGLLAAVLILYSGYVLYDTFATERAASSNVWDLLQFKPEIFDDYETPLNSASLSDINKDYRAWLTVYDTNIDYPVMQGPNDLYYASHDIYNRYSQTGAIYLAAGNKGDFSDNYNLIYGHHMGNGAMFGALDHMTGRETGVIVTGKEIYDVEFFASVNTDAYESRIYQVGNRMNSVLDFLRSGGEGGIGLGTTVTYFNDAGLDNATKIVALSTCADANTSGRLVLFGKMTRRVVTIDVSIAKIWDDADNQDGMRPESLTVTLSNGDTAELNEENGWKATLTVPKFDNRGEIPYTWTEAAVSGYTLTDSVYDTETRTTTLTNSHTPAVTTVAVSKVWNDDDNRDGIRPESVTAVLSNGMTAVLSNGMTAVLNEANGWTAAIENLPVYANGAAIEYTWSEEAVEGYELTVEGGKLTNTHAPATTVLTVSKVWNDNDNQDGIRPESVTVALYGNDAQVGSVTLSESNGWTDTISGLYVNVNGYPIVYRWEEEAVAGYTLSTQTDGDTTTLTNTHIPETIDLSVTKIWDDNDNQDGIRPRSLRVALGDGSNNSRGVTLNEGNSWSDTITGLPRYNAGEEITYTWTEADVQGYEQTGNAVNGRSTVITNRHATDTTVSTVIVVWDDEENRDGIRPGNAIVTLSNGQQITLNAENNWTATVTGLPVNADGVPVTYTWTESDIPYYTISSVVNGSTTTLTNRHTPDTADLTVVKVWEDNDNQDGIRPETLTVTLSADDEEVGAYTLSAENGWTATAAGQPVNANGRAIAYSWTEEAIDGYTMGTVVNGNDATITNTHTPAVTDITVTIDWDDNDDQDGLRPESVTVTLSNGEKVTLTPENNWTATIENVPVYEDGEPIPYTWTEDVPEGYTATPSTTGGTTTITNTHTPATTSLTVSKVWADDNDRDLMRPSTLAVYLQGNGTTVRTAALNAVNEWTTTLNDLPVNANGEAIVYTWTEETVNGYTMTAETTGTATTLTNTHAPETVDFTVSVNWNDDNNRDALRPDSVTLTLTGDDGSTREVVLTAENGWTMTVAVPANERGTPIQYTWTTTPVRDYSTEEETDGTTTTVTYTHVPATIALTIEKEWNDDNNADGMRPATLEMYLLVNGVVSQTIELSEANGWRYTAENLPVYENGEVLAYNWSEETVANYPRLNTASNGPVTTFTNTYVPGVTAVSVAIAWDDANNQDGMRPASVTLTLNANGTPVQTVTLTPGNNWSTALTNLPANENGEAIVYTWTEAAVPGYTRTGTNTVGTPNGVAASTVTYRHVPETINLTVRKEWIDDDPSKRPDYLNVVLTGTNGENEMVTLNPANEWTGTVTGLARYNAGREVQYTWTEPSVPGYTHTSTATADAMTVFTNTQVVTETPPTEYTLTVYYRFADGSTAAPAYTGTFREGDAYDVASPAIDGYYVTIPHVTGTMPGRNTVFTAIYMPIDETIIIEELDTPLGLGDSQMFLNIDDCLD